VNIDWDNDDHSVVRYEVTAASWPEFHLGMEQVNRLRNEVSHPVDLILVLPPTWNLPNQNVLGQLRMAHQNRPANAGAFSIVAGNTYIRTIVQLFVRVFRMEKQFLWGNSLDEVREGLQRMRGARKAAA
jgi:hypothetical protein